MQVGAVLTKTPAGVAALGNRQSGLTPRQRSLLILVDGRRRVDELTKLGAGLGDVADLLVQLQAAGFVAEVDAEGSGSSNALGASPPAAAALATMSLEQARRRAAQQLTDLVGPTGEDLCIRIERARDPSQYLQAVRQAEAMIRTLRGPAAADAFHAAWVTLRVT